MKKLLLHMCTLIALAVVPVTLLPMPVTYEWSGTCWWNVSDEFSDAFIAFRDGNPDKLAELAKNNLLAEVVMRGDQNEAFSYIDWRLVDRGRLMANVGRMYTSTKMENCADAIVTFSPLAEKTNPLKGQMRTLSTLSKQYEDESAAQEALLAEIGRISEEIQTQIEQLKKQIKPDIEFGKPVFWPLGRYSSLWPR